MSPILKEIWAKGRWSKEDKHLFIYCYFEGTRTVDKGIGPVPSDGRVGFRWWNMMGTSCTRIPRRRIAEGDARLGLQNVAGEVAGVVMEIICGG